MTRGSRGPVALLLVALLLSACGGGGGDDSRADEGGGGGDGGRASEGELLAEPDPLDVTLTLDDAHTGRATIGPSGGVVEATGADGTRYRLGLPKGALVEPTEITVTPVTAMDPQPLSGGLAGAVQLGPDGLQLAAMGVLTIRPASPPDPAATIGIGWTGSGESVAPRFAAGKPEAIQLAVTHFSGVGAGEATADDVKKLRQRAARQCSDQYEGDILAGADAVGYMQALGSETAGIDPQVVAELLVPWFDRCVRPRLEAGTTSDELLELGIGEYVRWKAYADFFGLSDENAEVQKRVGQGRVLIAKGLRAANQRATEDCEAHRLTAVKRMVRWQTLADLFGLSDEAGGEPDLSHPKFDERVRSCLTFELRYDADFTFEFPQLQPATEKVTGAVTVSTDVTQIADDGRIRLTGAGPIGTTQKGYDRFLSELGETFFQGFAMAGEALTGVDVPDEYTNPDLSRQQFYGCRVADPPPAAATPSIAGLVLADAPTGAIDATIPVALGAGMQVTCDQPVGTFDFPPFYFSTLVELNPDLVQGDALHLTGWQPGSGASWGTRSFSGDMADSGFRIHHDTKVELVHTPGKAQTTAPAAGGGSAFAPLE